MHGPWRANEPAEGETANCLYQVVDIDLMMAPTAQQSQRHPRTAKTATLNKLATGAPLRLVVATSSPKSPHWPQRQLTVLERTEGDGERSEYDKNFYTIALILP